MFHGGRRSWLARLCLSVVLLGVPAVGAGEETPRTISGPIAADTSWDGRIVVEQPITVAAGATLTIRPGAQVRFRESAGLLIEGTLFAEGTAESPIDFSPAAAEQGPWRGIALMNPTTASRLVECRVRHAALLTVTDGGHRIERCEISGGRLGIEVSGDTARPEIRGNSFHDLTEGGIRCLGKSAPLIERNSIERCGPFGVHASQGAAPLVRDNAVSGCGSGIELIQTSPHISGNRVRDCERGIALTYAAGGRPVQGNMVEGCRTGILVQRFSAPEIAENTVAGNGDGIVCHMGARPLIRNNEIRENQTGIVCNQMAAPTIEANVIERNRRGVFLNLSSYASVRGNDFEGNDVHLELGNMSRDWERRVGKKPLRGLQQQAAARTERGLVAPEAAGDGFDNSGGAIEASGNWWGEATTREMEKKGPEANIAGLRDWHDVPTLTYEGYEGEYVQDRIRYAPWAKERIASAGIPAAAPEGEGAGR